VCAQLPWFEDEPAAGLHLIHGAESGNGWYRPEDSEEGLIQLSRRTRLSLRLPRHRIDDAQSLTGCRLDINGHGLTVGESTLRPLSASSTLYARHVLGAESQEETVFLETVVAPELAAKGVACKKMVCGRSHRFTSPNGGLFARSLLLTDLKTDDSLKLQESGLGPGRKLGFGLFIAYKGLSKPESTFTY
jgi:CRISPR-associated protein Cas6